MTSYFAQATLLASSADSADNQVNGFAIGEVGSLDLTSATTWVGYIKAFYDDVKQAGGLRGLAQNGHTVKIYDINGTPPNYPLFELDFATTSAAVPIQLPLEVAVCISYKNTIANTIPRARRRGRIYISGWGTSQLGDGRPTETSMQSLLDAYTDYVQSVNTLTSLSAGVWSRTEGTVYPIDTVWVDNEYDTQRRRGGRPTAREEWTLP